MMTWQYFFLPGDAQTKPQHIYPVFSYAITQTAVQSWACAIFPASPRHQEKVFPFLILSLETGQQCWVNLPLSHTSTKDGSAVLHKETHSCWQSRNNTFPLMTRFRGKKITRAQLSCLREVCIAIWIYSCVLRIISNNIFF